MAFPRRKTTQAGPAQSCGPDACGSTPSPRRSKAAAGVVPSAAPLKRALAACRTGFVALFVFSMAINLLVLASPIYMMQLYDRVLSSHSMDTLALLTLIVLFAFAVMGALE